MKQSTFSKNLAIFHELLKSKKAIGVRGKEAAKLLNLKVEMIYRLRRGLCERSKIGIQPTASGYKLSQYCQKDEDMYYLKKAYGVKIGQAISLNAAREHIYSRWAVNNTDNRIIRDVFAPLVDKPQIFSRGLRHIQLFIPNKKRRNVKPWKTGKVVKLA
jgi:hypothetical protein